MEEFITPEIELIRYFNETTGRRAREIKSNIAPIKARLKEGFTIEEIKKAILLKTIEWKNNPEMSQHLCIETIFRAKKLEKYVNQVAAIEANPEMYRNHYEQLKQNQQSSGSPAGAFSKIDAMFGKRG